MYESVIAWLVRAIQGISIKHNELDSLVKPWNDIYCPTLRKGQRMGE